MYLRYALCSFTVLSCDYLAGNDEMIYIYMLIIAVLVMTILYGYIRSISGKHVLETWAIVRSSGDVFALQFDKTVLLI